MRKKQAATVTASMLCCRRCADEQGRVNLADPVHPPFAFALAAQSVTCSDCGDGACPRAQDHLLPCLVAE